MGKGIELIRVRFLDKSVLVNLACKYLAKKVSGQIRDISYLGGGIVIHGTCGTAVSGFYEFVYVHVLDGSKERAIQLLEESVKVINDNLKSNCEYPAIEDLMPFVSVLDKPFIGELKKTVNLVEFFQELSNKHFDELSGTLELVKPLDACYITEKEISVGDWFDEDDQCRLGLRNTAVVVFPDAISVRNCLVAELIAHWINRSRLSPLQKGRKKGHFYKTFSSWSHNYLVLVCGLSVPSKFDCVDDISFFDAMYEEMSYALDEYKKGLNLEKSYKSRGLLPLDDLYLLTLGELGSLREIDSLRSSISLNDFDSVFHWVTNYYSSNLGSAR